MEIPHLGDIEKGINAHDDIIKAITKAINTLRLYGKLVEEKHIDAEADKDYIESLDAQLLLALSSLDIAISMKYLDVNAFVNNNIEANYFARVLALNCHELFNNINKHFDKPLQKYRELPKFKDAWLRIEKKRIEMNKYKNEVSGKIEEIRHKLIAHRGGKGLEQSNKMRDIDLKEIFDIGAKSNGYIKELLSLSAELLLGFN